MSLTYGSLFSGVGGFDLGFDQEGYDCRFQVEWDPHCQETLRYHWPTVPKWLDVQDVSGSELPPCDVITFGSPCQDLSVAGRRRGLAGERSGLFFEALRIIEEMRNGTNGNVPRVAVWENVAGALFSNRGADFGRVLDEMAELGALVIEWAVVDSQWFGVPQRRRRVFVVAVFDPVVAERCTEPLLPVFARSGWDPEARKESGEIATTYAGAGTPGGGRPESAGDVLCFDNSYRDGARVRENMTSTLSAKMGTGGLNTPMILEPIGFDSHASGAFKVHADGKSPAVRIGSALNIPSPPAVAQPILEQDSVSTLQARYYKGADVEGALGGQLVPYPSNELPVIFAENQRAELRESESSPSITTGGGKPGMGYPAVRQGAVVRRLTPLECERLMGWPDDHTLYRADGTTNSDTNRYKMCGNGVVAPVSRWIAKRISRVLSEQ